MNAPIFVFEEFSFNLETRKRTKVADWKVFPADGDNGRVIIQKQSATKVFRVDDDCEFVFKALKTKIKAIGGAAGLVNWMIQDKDFMSCRIVNLLNFAWDTMKVAKN